MLSAFWHAASSCIVPMTLISFIVTRPPACTGVERTPMCTTVSTPAAAMTLPMIGLRMSARTKSAPPMSSRGGTMSTPTTRSTPGSRDRMAPCGCQVADAEMTPPTAHAAPPSPARGPYPSAPDSTTEGDDPAGRLLRLQRCSYFFTTLNARLLQQLAVLLLRQRLRRFLMTDPRSQPHLSDCGAGGC
jgi:hypothetical protein